jgi:PAS domain S-box-containing protein
LCCFLDCDEIMTGDASLYNSRIFQIYFDFLRVTYPQINIQQVLDHAGMTAAEVSDSAHWFTQQQADRFYEIVAEKTGDGDIARKAGRFAASSAGLALINQYVVGLLNTETALLAMKKIYPLLTRGATVDVRKIGRGKVEIISTPLPDVEEKPYQCENRLGTIEALPKLFTNVHGRIEHPACFHKGDGACRYIISWDTPPSLAVRLLRNYSLLVSLLLLPLLYFFVPTGVFWLLLVFLLGLNGLLSIGYAHLKIKEMEKIIESSSLAAEERIETARTSYNNSLLVQEIGQATAAILNIDELMRKLATLMNHRLDFDRGLIMLANETGTQLVYAAGYGYSEEEQGYLQKTAFQLDNPGSKGFFVRSFFDRKHLIITNANEMVDALSDKSRKLVQVFGVRSLLCIPIIFKDTALGILAVDNVTSKIPLKKSDINLLEGIAAHIAISINNARSFQKLQESENRYRQTLESIEEGYFEINLDRRIMLVNKAFNRLVHRPVEHLSGGVFDRLFTPDSAIELGRMFAQMLDSGEPVRFVHLALADQAGEAAPVDLSVSVIVDQNRVAAGFRGFLRDATDRLKLEEERKELENRLLRAQKMESIGTLAGGIAHNFNNWLAGILGNVTLIRLEAKQESKVIERAAKIEQIVANAAKMNQQLLSYAHGGNYAVKPTNLNMVIQDTSDLFANTRKDVTVTLELDPDLHTVGVDKNQIEQVFWNLYVNAMDAMPDGGRLRIKTANATADQRENRPFEVVPGDHVMVEFTDTGSGIAPEHLQTIFEPFFTTKKGKGTGLGLASCYGIVKAHKGFIDVKTQLGLGTSFQIFLPAISASPEHNRQIDAAVQKGQGTILIVDDDPMVLDTSVQLLSGLGYSVLSAASGDEALEHYAGQLDAIDLVIIDMIMPGMSGGELFARIKGLKPGMNTLLCSGYSMNDAARAIMEQGCDGFLQKPFSLSKLSEAIGNILKPEQQRAGRRSRLSGKNPVSAGI